VRKQRAFIGIGLLIATAAAAFALINRPQGAAARPEGKPVRAASPAALALRGVKVEPRTFSETIIANGTLRADESVELQPEVNGKITSLNFEEGRRIRSGEVLVKIQDAPLQASRRRALARRDLAEFRRARLGNLVRNGGVSQQDYDEAVGEVDVLNAEIQLIEAEITKTEIRAPFDGVVGLRFVSVGAYVNPTTRIATLQRVSELKVDFSVPERYVSSLRPGSPLTFTVAGRTTVYRGEVYAVDPRIDLTTRTVLLRARTEAADDLLPGLFARVEFTVNQDEAALLVPAISVLYGLEERFVFVARDGRAERVPVVLGARTDTQVQIASGLAQGDIVLTTGIQQLRPGLPITVEVHPL